MLLAPGRFPFSFSIRCTKPDWPRESVTVASSSFAAGRCGSRAPSRERRCRQTRGARFVSSFAPKHRAGGTGAYQAGCKAGARRRRVRNKRGGTRGRAFYGEHAKQQAAAARGQRVDVAFFAVVGPEGFRARHLPGGVALYPKNHLPVRRRRPAPVCLR